MDDFPKYPTDFIVMTRPFEDEETERLLQQKVSDVAFTVNVLKQREINATKALEKLRLKIESTIISKEKELEFSTNAPSFTSVLEGQINLLENLLE